MPTAGARSRWLVAALIDAAALVAGSSHTSGAKAAESTAMTGARAPVIGLKADSNEVTVEGITMGRTSRHEDSQNDNPGWG
jgi:hypothetical protein